MFIYCLEVFSRLRLLEETFSLYKNVGTRPDVNLLQPDLVIA